MSHIWMRLITHLNVRRVRHLNEACHTCDRGTLHVWMPYECTSHIWMPFECGMSHTWMWPMPHINAAQHAYESSTWHIWYNRARIKWAVRRMCGMLHVWTCLTHIWMTYKCGISHWWLRPATVVGQYKWVATHKNAARHTYAWGTSRIWMWHVTNINTTWHTTRERLRKRRAIKG